MKYVGVDIGGTNLKAGLVDESGTLLATQKMKVASIVDREGLAWTVASLVQELAKAANIPVSDVASVGVGVPGTVDIRAGSIAYTCNLPLRAARLLGAIRQRHGAEAHDGRGTGGLPGQYSGAGHHGE